MLYGLVSVLFRVPARDRDDDVSTAVTPSLIPPPRGRGASWNPQNRFERLHLEPDLADLEEAGELDQPAPATVYYRDKTQSVIAYNDSPDVGFDAGINPYRGCSHGCSYLPLPRDAHSDGEWNDARGGTAEPWR